MGGPIKQGIMHGIREPKRHGGKMLLVGQHPKEFHDKSGREKHLAPILVGIAHAARMAAPWAARMGSRYLKPLFRKQIGTQTVQKAGPSQVIKGGTKYSKGYPGGKVTEKIIGPGTAEIPKYGPTWLGRDPTVRLIGGAGKSIFNPTTAGWAGKAGRFVGSPTVIIGGLYFANGRWFNKKGDELDPNSTEVATAKAKGGDKDYGPHTKGGPTITQEMRDAKAKADKEKRINALLDTMGYDKARKNAAYDALMDAGRMVSERGSLRAKDIGKELIDPIVATTSQRFDKPEQIREAVGLMQVKADIAKQMEDPQVKALRALEIEKGEKALSGNTLEETAEAIYTRHNQWPTGEALAYLARNKNIPIVDVVDTGNEEVGDPVTYMEGQIAQAVQDGVATPPGNYVIGKDIIIVDSEGNVSRR